MRNVEIVKKLIRLKLLVGTSSVMDIQQPDGRLATMLQCGCGGVHELEFFLSYERGRSFYQPEHKQCRCGAIFVLKRVFPNHVLAHRRGCWAKVETYL